MTSILGLIVVFFVLALVLSPLALVLWVVTKLGGKIPPQGKESVKDDIVKAQLEYDRTWKKLK